MKRISARAAAAAAALLRALRSLAAWLSFPANFALSALGLAFLVSAASLALGDRLVERILFFPAASDLALRAETRELPRTRGGEATAFSVASELLLGPLEPGQVPAFEPGIRVESVLYRRRVLYLDLSEAAALSGRPALERGLRALEKSLRAALPGMRRLRLTIGGREPWVDSLAAAGEGPSAGPGNAAPAAVQEAAAAPAPKP